MWRLVQWRDSISDLVKTLQTVFPFTVLVLVVLLVLVACAVPLVFFGIIKAGIHDKTLWDWIQVGGTPLVVIVTIWGLLLKVQSDKDRQEKEQEFHTESTYDATLKAYLASMTDLVLRHNLSCSDQNSPVRAVAQAHTYAVLHQLDPKRKGILVSFLHEAGLIKTDCPVISFHLADLTRADLSGADLRGACLSGANLRDADFEGCNLQDADLARAVIDEGDLKEAVNLVGATMPDGSKWSG